MLLTTNQIVVVHNSNKFHDERSRILYQSLNRARELKKTLIAIIPIQTIETMGNFYNSFLVSKDIQKVYTEVNLIT